MLTRTNSQAYLEFLSPQAATAVKRHIDGLQVGEGGSAQQRRPSVVFHPINNPFKTLPKDAPQRQNRDSQGRSTPAGPNFHNGPPVNNFQGGNPGGGGYQGGYRGRGGYNRGGPRGGYGNNYGGSNMNAFNNNNMGFNGPMGGGGFNRGGMGSGFQNRGGPNMRGRGGMNPMMGGGPMMANPMAMGGMMPGMNMMGGGMGGMGKLGTFHFVLARPSLPELRSARRYDLTSEHPPSFLPKANKLFRFSLTQDSVVCLAVNSIPAASDLMVITKAAATTAAATKVVVIGPTLMA